MHTSQDVSGSRFAGRGTTETLISSFRIRKQVRSSISVATRRRLNRADSRCPTSDVPVGRPATEVHRGAYRQSTVVTEDRSKHPATQQAVHNLVRAAQGLAATSKWNFPNRVEIHDVGDVKVRNCTVVTLTQCVG